MACEICKDKISSKLKRIIKNPLIEHMNKWAKRNKVVSGGFIFEKQLKICSICSSAIKEFGGPIFKYEHLDMNDISDPTIRLKKGEEDLLRTTYSKEQLKFLKSKKRLIGKVEAGGGLSYDADKLYLDNSKYFFNNLKRIYNDIIDYYKILYL